MLHLDLDAFFASVEQRDKPSLRGRPVVVGGVGQRGVVATASYEARVFGVRSAMPAHEARRRCPHAAFLTPRFGVYRTASGQVMTILRALSPLVEPLSLDEAFVDLAAAQRPVDTSVAGLHTLVAELKAQVAEATGGLRASVGVGSSKFIAKIATELGKPDGVYVVEPGREVALLAPLPLTVIPGVGPVTADKLHRIGLQTVADLRAAGLAELVQTVGRAHGQGLLELAFARDDRGVEPEREAKSISVEDTFESDLTDPTRLHAVIADDARQVAARLTAARLFARTVTLKVRQHDFTTQTRSRTIRTPTDRADQIAELARGLLSTVDITGGLRLLGVGVAGLTDARQDQLFADDQPDDEPDDQPDDQPDEQPDEQPDDQPDDQSREPPDHRAEESRPRTRRWPPGADVRHDERGPGWVWGSGLGRVTVRFETQHTPPGPVATFADDDPRLHLGHHPDHPTPDPPAPDPPAPDPPAPDPPAPDPPAP